MWPKTFGYPAQRNNNGPKNKQLKDAFVSKLKKKKKGMNVSSNEWIGFFLATIVRD